jgi:hypothetical protein
MAADSVVATSCDKTLVLWLLAHYATQKQQQILKK